jgi:threonine/homoserine/homoserine lactone efflux protein
MLRVWSGDGSMFRSHYVVVAAILASMVLLVGFLTGLALVAPVGPVALTLFGLGAERGRRAALAGAGGVVLADSLTMPVALGSAGFVASLDSGVVRTFEVVMGLALVALAISTIVATDRARQAVAGIRRPVRTMAVMTIVNPLSLVAWAGVALALPTSLRSPAALAVFGLGLVLASAFWHSGLAMVAGSIARRMGEGPRTVVTRVSGVVLLVVGGVLVA